MLFRLIVHLLALLRLIGLLVLILRSAIRISLCCIRIAVGLPAVASRTLLSMSWIWVRRLSIASRLARLMGLCLSIAWVPMLLHTHAHAMTIVVAHVLWSRLHLCLCLLNAMLVERVESLMLAQEALKLSDICVHFLDLLKQVVAVAEHEATIQNT